MIALLEMQEICAGKTEVCWIFTLLEARNQVGETWSFGLGCIIWTGSCIAIRVQVMSGDTSSY